MEEETVASETVQPSREEVIVDGWFHETFGNRGLDVQEWNRLYAAKATLIAALMKKE
jgi:hypothetical protein